MSSSSIKPLLLHGHPGPSPWKVTLLLEELNIPYTTKLRTTPQLKEEEFLKINRNGMSPVLDDENTGIRLAESDAISEYLLSQYDTKHLLSFSSLKEKYLMRQWMQFSTSSHGPILRALFYFTNSQPIPDARTYYITTFRHILSVLENELEGKDWLVGDKCSAADLAFVSFQSRIGFIMRDAVPDMQSEFPRVNAWYGRMAQREKVKKVTKEHLAALRWAGFAVPE